MIDVDKIEERCKSAMQNGYGHLPVIECGNAVKISELIGLLRQSEKDASRYRWLRECTTEQSEMMVDNGHVVGFGVLDALIDEAMSVNQA